ncbi:hypothetical protein DF185_00565 [Marinifilum breve]|uniref:Calcineurin-like phosphoesterase domain-containing protein n=1 Tax=Marinifilum breve TaxID=2184082 RepID=A0A2V4A5G8_9BACT|nr:metallophosphoesterase [Marinifilum breve]PXY02620.1 hypothetical protein DF185_00565 [Marinifilum breve]
MSKYIPYVILFTFFTLLILSVVYLSKRTAWSFDTSYQWPFYLFFSAISIFMLGGVMSNIQSVDSNGHIIFVVGAITMGVFLFVLLSFLFTDIINIYFRFSPFRFGLVALGVTTLLTIYGVWNASHQRVKYVDVRIDGLEKNLKLVHLSDIHLGHFRGAEFLEKMVKKTNAQHADAIFITGDYLDAKIALKNEHFEPLKKLNAPIYFVEGNHDEHTDIEAINSKMREVGVRVLENEIVKFNGIQIVGLNHMLADKETFDMHASPFKPTVKTTLAELQVQANQPAVLLHHAPNGIKYASQYGIDLYLAGHTHAGQIFPFNLLSEFLFEYNRGLHEYQGTKVFVSEGVGTAGPPMRLGTQSEIVVINLIANQS